MKAMLNGDHDQLGIGILPADIKKEVICREKPSCLLLCFPGTVKKLSRREEADDCHEPQSF